jgi:hypothetical protein
MQSPASGADRARRRRPLTPWLILAVCAAPIAASYLAYYLWHPGQHTNYGELIEPRSLPDSNLATFDGVPFRWTDLKGEWVLLTLDPGACDSACRTRLVYTRQVRLAQGRETARVERVWIVIDGRPPDPALVAEHPGLRVLRAGSDAFVNVLPAGGSARDHVYVVDPLGHLMMRFPADPDPRRMLKDISRLLRHSKWK